MLVLSRRPQDKILIPSINACIHVAAIQPGIVRVAIDAPTHVTILRGELQDRRAEWAPPTPPPEAPPHQSHNRITGGKRCRMRRLTRRQLRDASVRLGVARLQLQVGLIQEAKLEIDRVQQEIQTLRRCLEYRKKKSTARPSINANPTRNTRAAIEALCNLPRSVPGRMCV